MFLKLVRILTARDRWMAASVLLLSIVMSATEVVGIGSIFAYVRVVADPSLISSSEILAAIRGYLNIGDDTEFLTIAGFGLIAVVVVRNAVAAATMTLRTYFAQTMTRRLAQRRMRRYLEQRYETFLTLNTGELRKNILVEVGQLTSGYLVAGILVFCDALTSSAILGFLAWQQPMITGLAVLGLGIIYMGVYMLIRHRSTRLGYQGRVAAEQVFRTTDEAFRGIKEIKLQGGEDYFTGLFANAARRLARIGIFKALIAQLPRYLIETVIFVGLLAVVLSTVGQGLSAAETIAVIALFAMSGYRLIPLLSQLFSSVSQMRTTRAVAESLVTEFREGPPPPAATVAPLPPLPFAKEITLDRLSYRYPSADTDVVVEVTLRLKKGNSIAFVGPTGAGKSTLVENFMGLLIPTGGRILIDGEILTQGNLRAWQQQVAYVPQQVHYLDDTVAQNIAFAVASENIDMAAVIEAATRAHLHEFIEQDLADDYQTYLGEGGARFSGGQLQRLAIARALYRRPALLVLDEATSALDTVTENIITETIRELAGSVTTITIAHRLQTVRHSDVIYVLERGRIATSGSYEYLLGHSEAFRAMAG